MPKIQALQITDNGTTSTYDITLSKGTDLEIHRLYLNGNSLYLTSTDSSTTPHGLFYDSTSNSFRLGNPSGTFVKVNMGTGDESRDNVGELGLKLDYSTTLPLGMIDGNIYGPQFKIQGFTNVYDEIRYLETRYGTSEISYDVINGASTLSKSLYFPGRPGSGARTDTIATLGDIGTVATNVSTISTALNITKSTLSSTVSTLSATVSTVNNLIHTGSVTFSAHSENIFNLTKECGIRFWKEETTSVEGGWVTITDYVNIISAQHRHMDPTEDEYDTVFKYTTNNATVPNGTKLYYKYIDID